MSDNTASRSNDPETTPPPGTAPEGRPVWIDLTTNDADRARAFYGAVFGWTFEDTGAGFGHYHMISSGAASIGGLMGRTPEMGEGPSQWTVYLHTPDARSTCDKALARGGGVLVPPMPVGDLGTMGMVIDPGQVATGFWQPDRFEGTEVMGVAGAPCWFEIFTAAYDTSLDFYREVFGWDVATMSDAGNFRYSTTGSELGAVAGIMAADFLDEEHPGYWRTYLGTTDVDATAEKIGALGGSLLGDIQDSPYGRFGEVTDDQGARFVIVQAPAA